MLLAEKERADWASVEGSQVFAIQWERWDQQLQACGWSNSASRQLSDKATLR
jgi:hypothetical protein